MSEQLDAVARRIDDAVRGVPGVVDVYSARPLVARAVRRLVDDDAPLALVQEKSGEMQVTVSVALEAARTRAGASEVTDAVVAAVRVAASDGQAAVKVRVSRVLVSGGGLGAASGV
jgi:hypothetical protein